MIYASDSEMNGEHNFKNLPEKPSCPGDFLLSILDISFVISEDVVFDIYID